MSTAEEIFVGYVAIYSSQQMYCEHGACIVAGTQSFMNKYLKASSSESKEYQKRKTLFHQIVDGMEMGGAYAFDLESYKIFNSLAKKVGLNLIQEDKPPAISGQSFIFNSLEKL
ncbi:hypothetical protein [Teredinibacter purpureus]|uniref:hypothetical protein n=1 Tax=Teredinibacter purpureus TaxID=2731756 RepID=UPI0005F87059|nr:hypothetical protein [Teredinibacter purpureus]